MESRSGPEKRRTINMNEAIAEELNEVANLQGKTAYGFVNETALTAIEAHRKGFSLKEAVEAKILLDKVKKNRLILVNQDLWYYASDLAYRRRKDEWLERVYEKAKWYGLVFLDVSSNQRFQQSFKETLQYLFWDCSGFELKENEDKTLSLRAHFTPEMSLEHTHVVLRSIEGILNSAGYAIIRHVIEKGYLTVIVKQISIPSKNI